MILEHGTLAMICRVRQLYYYGHSIHAGYKFKDHIVETATKFGAGTFPKRNTYYSE